MTIRQRLTALWCRLRNHKDTWQLQMNDGHLCLVCTRCGFSTPGWRWQIVELPRPPLESGDDDDTELANWKEVTRH